MTSEKCRAKDPASCRYHGFLQLFSGKDKKAPLFTSQSPVEYEANQQKFWDTLDFDDQVAIADWTTSNYQHKLINTALRRGNWAESQYAPVIDKLDALTNSYVAPEPRTIYRGVHGHYGIPNLRKNDVYSDRGFMSATSSISTAVRFIAGFEYPTIFRITTAKGIPVSFKNGMKESEFLLPRSSQYKVAKITKVKNLEMSSNKHVVMVIDLEEL